MPLKETLEKINKIYDSVFDIQYLDVFDLIPGIKFNKSSVDQRTKGLKKVLKQFDKKYPSLDLVLIEYQMCQNFKSNELFSQIYFHYSDKCPVHSVGPSLKNTLAFSKDNRYSNFTQKYATLYTANKNHASANLKYWLKLFNKEEFLDNINKKNVDDAADSFLTIVGFMVTQPGF